MRFLGMLIMDIPDGKEWWEYLNVKTTTKGTRKRNKNADPLTNENLDEFTEFISKFESWGYRLANL